ncbi:sigma-70 family RNA polymerase sigma factor [Arthrobacter livingstonensis]|nr:sigma-70 family RNA polymerase sigma factor [Arthrobacter livingstonensis]
MGAGTDVLRTVTRTVGPGNPASSTRESPNRATTGTGAGAEQLVLQFLGLADALSRCFYRSGCEAEDLQQVARLGLVKAAKGYQEDKGQGFVAYAVPTITGELKRYVRDHSWVVRPARAIQEARLKIRRVRPELIQRLGREPTYADLSLAAGLSVPETVQALLAESAMVAQRIEHYDPQGGREALFPGVTLTVEELGYERVEREQALATALVDASEEERLILHLRFVEEMSQEQIAQELGVSQMQISRRLKQLLDRLGRRLVESR